jgi:hypothetical protein
MRHVRIPALVASLLALTACAGSTGGEAPVPRPSPSLLAACARPVALPNRAMTQAEVEVSWGRDRSALRACVSRHAGLVEWVGIP